MKYLKYFLMVIFLCQGLTIAQIFYSNDMETDVPFNNGSQSSVMAQGGTYSELLDATTYIHDLRRYDNSSKLPTLGAGESFNNFIYTAWINDNDNPDQEYRLYLKFAKEDGSGGWIDSGTQYAERVNIGSGWQIVSHDFTTIVNDMVQDGYTHIARIAIRKYVSPYEISYVDDVLLSYDVALPVELTTFTASIKDSEVNLVWETATEVNNYGFKVERRPETGDWENISFIQGHGNSNSPKFYEFTDKSESSGKYFYRLKQIDIDGSFEYSKTVEVDLGLPTEFQLSQNYPNPFNPTTIIQYSIPIGDENIRPIQLKVYDVLSNEVVTLVNKSQEAGNYKVNFDASNLTSGIYFYTLTSGSFVQTKKMILLR